MAFITLSVGRLRLASGLSTTLLLLSQLLYPRMPKTIVYAGRGSSHSWTWLADLFENRGVLSTRFLDSQEFISSLSGNVDVSEVIISGGDGFAIADALRGQGFRNLEKFILNGGRYVGICAGAYLPLPSSVEPFSTFNISTTRIENIRCDARGGNAYNPREVIPYGNCSIVHPIRGPIEITDDSRMSIVAPLYGGPIFKEPERDTVVMRYKSFTPEMEFQSDRATAEAMILNRPAVIRVVHGDGGLVLFGPHLEHPRYPQANDLFLRRLGYAGSNHPGGGFTPMPEKSRSTELNRSISNLKVAILGLENRSFTVGHKAWDGSRLVEILSAIEKRQWTLTDGCSELVTSNLVRVREQLMAMTVGADYDADMPATLLIEAARITVDNHFAVLAERECRSSGGISRTS
jgi:glutamine amidotransferase-like uncharacterized protein